MAKFGEMAQASSSVRADSRSGKGGQELVSAAPPPSDLIRPGDVAPEQPVPPNGGTAIHNETETTLHRAKQG